MGPSYSYCTVSYDKLIFPQERQRKSPADVWGGAPSESGSAKSASCHDGPAEKGKPEAEPQELVRKTPAYSEDVYVYAWGLLAMSILKAMQMAN
jgi:hypothetical protein